MKKILTNMSLSVKAGHELSAAMAKYPKVFGSIAIGMIAAGEGSGQLTDALKTTASHLKDNQNLVANKNRTDLTTLFRDFLNAYAISSLPAKRQIKL